MAEVEPRLLADLGQRNGAENGPQRLAVGKLEFAPLGSTQESPAGRLHNVFRADSTTQSASQVFVCQAAQRLAEFARKPAHNVRIAGTEPLDQAGPFRVVIGLDVVWHRRIIISPRVSVRFVGGASVSAGCHWLCQCVCAITERSERRCANEGNVREVFSRRIRHVPPCTPPSTIERACHQAARWKAGIEQSAARAPQAKHWRSQRRPSAAILFARGGFALIFPVAGLAFGQPGEHCFQTLGARFFAFRSLDPFDILLALAGAEAVECGQRLAVLL